jgi:membrane associated rhomboid family serine protease
MFVVRDGDLEVEYTAAELKAKIRKGLIEPHVDIQHPEFTGGQFVKAADVSFFSNLYDPRRVHFARYFSVSRMPVFSLAIAGIMIAIMIAVQHMAGDYGFSKTMTLLGAKSRPRVFEQGETWRLLAANMIHRDWSHLFLNLVAFLNIGAILEGVYRRGDYVLLLVTSAVSSMAVSAVFATSQTVGSSGIVFGCLGCGVVFGFRYRDLLPKTYKRYFGSIIIGYTGLMFGLGLWSSDTDNWGHSGGAVAGALFGLVLVPRLMRFGQQRQAAWVILAPYGCSLLILVGLIFSGPILERYYSHLVGHMYLSGNLTLQAPRAWTRTDAPGGYMTLGNGEDAFVLLHCIEAPAPRTLNQLAEDFATTELGRAKKKGEIEDFQITKMSHKAEMIPGIDTAIEIFHEMTKSGVRLYGRTLVFHSLEKECTFTAVNSEISNEPTLDVLNGIHASMKLSRVLNGTEASSGEGGS